MIANDNVILAIGPAFSDILLQLRDKEYELIQKKFFSSGTWIRLSDRHKLNALFKALDIVSPADYMEAGSTILGTLSAMPLNIRRNSTIITYEGTDNNQISFKSYNRYVNTVRNLGINLRVKQVKGANMIGMVFVSNSNRERLLLTYSDYNISFSDDMEIPSAEYLLINGFEMVEPTNNLIYDLIESRNYKVVLGLGSQNILHGEFKNRLIEYCKKGYIHCIGGNYQEFQKLYPCNVKLMREEDVFSSIPYILVTLGKNGMIGYDPNVQYYQSAAVINDTDLISTSGAGDIALGIFLTGIINQENLQYTLSKAALVSTKIMRRLSNVFSEGIENVHNMC